MTHLSRHLMILLSLWLIKSTYCSGSNSVHHNPNTDPLSTTDEAMHSGQNLKSVFTPGKPFISITDQCNESGPKKDALNKVLAQAKLATFAQIDQISFHGLFYEKLHDPEFDYHDNEMEIVKKNRSIFTEEFKKSAIEKARQKILNRDYSGLRDIPVEIESKISLELDEKATEIVEKAGNKMLDDNNLEREKSYIRREAIYASAKRELTNNQIRFKAANDATMTDQMRENLKFLKKHSKIRLLVHGWADSIDSHFGIDGVEWPVAIADEWSRQEKVHVFFVNYPAFSQANYVPAAGSYIHDVARAIKHFLNYITSMLFDDEDDHAANRREYLATMVQAAGHSLGAHVLGSLAHQLQIDDHLGTTILQVIYGLDPAGVLFEKLIFTFVDERFFRLNKKHAKSVIILHTEWTKRGIKYAIGHLDFYGNGNTVQPGCEGQKESCSHQRALNLFRASLKMYTDELDEFRLVGHRCGDMNGNQPTSDISYARTAIFGINYDFDKTDREEGIYYMPTARCKPYNHVANRMDRIINGQCTMHEDTIYRYDLFRKNIPTHKYYAFQTGSNPILQHNFEVLDSSI